MITIKEIIEEIKKIEGVDITEFVNAVIVAFHDYELEGETDVIVSKDESNSNIDYQAYIDHEDSPIICIEIEKDEDYITVVNAW